MSARAVLAGGWALLLALAALAGALVVEALARVRWDREH